MSVKENEIKQEVLVKKIDETKPDNMAKDHEIKHEVVSAYNEVLRKLNVMKAAAPKEEKMKDVEEERAREEDVHIVEITTNETPDDLVKNFSEMKAFVNRELKTLEDQLLPLYEKFHTLRRAIAFSEKELNELHGIKVQADTLNALLMTQKEKAAVFEKDMLDRRRAFEQEKAQHEKMRTQEENEYILKRDASRKLENEKYDNMKRELERELTNKRTAFEEEMTTRESRLAARENEHRQLKEREARITAREQEYQQLKEKAARFPEELRTAVQRIERSVVEQLTRKHEYDTRLAHIELESERKLYQQKISALEDQIEQYKQLKQQYAQSAFNNNVKAKEEA